MDKKLLRHLLEKYEAGTCTDDERELLHRFFDAFQKDQVSSAENADEEIRADILARLNARIDETEEESGGGFQWRVAASILLALGFAAALFLYYYTPAEKMIALSTQSGERMNATLPDGSVVTLNAGSTLSYPETFRKNRAVSLKGEAFFDVKPDPTKPFVVETGAVRTTVLGTSFNVNAYDFRDEIQVTVVSGKVQVASANQRLELNPGEQAAYKPHHDSLERRAVNAEALVAWTDGALRFDGANLREIMEVLHLWYGVEIVMDTAMSDNCDLKMTFRNLSLSQVLDQLKRVTGIEYTINENRVRITGVGCKP